MRGAKRDRIRALRSQIHEAFANVPYPGNSSLTGLPDINPDKHRLEKAFCGKDWRQLINVKFVHRYYDCVSYFTDAAYFYFLPAYLITVLEYYDDAHMLPLSVLGELSSVLHTQRGKGSDWAKRRDAMYTTAQKRAIAAFLEYIRDEHGKDYSGKEGTKLERLIAYFKGAIASEQGEAATDC